MVGVPMAPPIVRRLLLAAPSKAFTERHPGQGEGRGIALDDAGR